MSPYLTLLRPPQWIKNVFVFAALVFGGKLGDTSAIVLSLYAFAAFCMASSAGYILNDILDRERDRLHPKKKERPIASGKVKPGAALALMVLLIAGVGFISFGLLHAKFALAVFGYLGLTIAYSLALKHRVILDVIVIAMLFVIRALGGAFALEVDPSAWLLVCTFLLCLFLCFGKRRCEIAMLGDAKDQRKHRATLEDYTPNLLTHLLSTSGGIAIITFLLYTMDTSYPSPFDHVRKQNLMYTLPLVAYGIYRYAMLIELGKATGPTDLIIKDPPFVISILLWIGLAGWILYGGAPV